MARAARAYACEAGGHGRKARDAAARAEATIRRAETPTCKRPAPPQRSAREPPGPSAASQRRARDSSAAARAASGTRSSTSPRTGAGARAEAGGRDRDSSRSSGARSRAPAQGSSASTALAPMIAHVVLYEMRPDLDTADRDHLHHTIRTTFGSVPSLRRWMIGRRITLGLSYEIEMHPGYEYAAVLEFDDRTGLLDYLDHPLHAELAKLFWSCSTRTLVFDYEMVAGDPGTAHTIGS